MYYVKIDCANQTLRRSRKKNWPEDINQVLDAADPETQDYLWTIRDTMGRVSEINRLTWDDVDLNGRTITLYTRKKQGET